MPSLLPLPLTQRSRFCGSTLRFQRRRCANRVGKEALCPGPPRGTWSKRRASPPPAEPSPLWKPPPWHPPPIKVLPKGEDSLGALIDSAVGGRLLLGADPPQALRGTPLAPISRSRLSPMGTPKRRRFAHQRKQDAFFSLTMVFKAAGT